MSENVTAQVKVGRQLARRREDLDFTQEGLAKRIGVAARTVSAVERGVNVIRLGKRPMWEEALRLRAGTISRAYRDGSAIEPTSTTSEPEPSEPGETPMEEWTLEDTRAAIADLQRKVQELEARYCDDD